MEKNMKNKVLFISATHGDEGFSIPILNVLEKEYSKIKYNYDWIIGNPRALKLKIRGTEGNLNRLAPGNARSKIYEEKRAYEIMQIARKFDYVIDLHGARSDCGIVIIICNPTLSNFILAGMLNINRIVIWSTNEDLTKGPITQFCKTGLEIECGKKTDPKIQKKLEKILAQFVLTYQSNDINNIIKNLREKEIFQVYDKLIKQNSNLQDFKLVREKDEQFYPFMSNQYPDLACYKLKKVKFTDLFLSQSKI